MSWWAIVLLLVVAFVLWVKGRSTDDVIGLLEDLAICSVCAERVSSLIVLVVVLRHLMHPLGPESRCVQLLCGRLADWEGERAWAASTA